MKKIVGTLAVLASFGAGWIPLSASAAVVYLSPTVDFQSSTSGDGLPAVNAKYLGLCDTAGTCPGLLTSPQSPVVAQDGANLFLNAAGQDDTVLTIHTDHVISHIKFSFLGSFTVIGAGVNSPILSSTSWVSSGQIDFDPATTIQINSQGGLDDIQFGYDDTTGGGTVPEPTSLALVALAFGGAAASRKRR